MPTCIHIANVSLDMISENSRLRRYLQTVTVGDEHRLLDQSVDFQTDTAAHDIVTMLNIDGSMGARPKK